MYFFTYDVCSRYKESPKESVNLQMTFWNHHYLPNFMEWIFVHPTEPSSRTSIWMLDLFTCNARMKYNCLLFKYFSIEYVTMLRLSEVASCVWITVYCYTWWYRRRQKTDLVFKILNWLVKNPYFCSLVGIFLIINSFEWQET